MLLFSCCVTETVSKLDGTKLQPTVVKNAQIFHLIKTLGTRFGFEDFNGNIGKFLPRNTEHCKSSEFMLRA